MEKGDGNLKKKKKMIAQRKKSKCCEDPTTRSKYISSSFLIFLHFQRQNGVIARPNRGHNSREVPLYFLAPTALQSHDKIEVQ